MEQELTAEEKWNKATLANNFIFYKVMRSHPEECKHLIEMLLKLKIQKMEMRSEEVIAIDHDAKSIRLDVYVKDESKMYDIEIQIADTLELPERARYYAALMALDSLKEGDDYKNLRDGHVIFLCMKDIFHQGLPVYTFENVCNELYILRSDLVVGQHLRYIRLLCFFRGITGHRASSCHRCCHCQNYHLFHHLHYCILHVLMPLSGRYFLFFCIIIPALRKRQCSRVPFF